MGEIAVWHPRRGAGPGVTSRALSGRVTPRRRDGLVSLLTGQLGPRISLRTPISMGVLPERAAETFGRTPIYLDAPFQIDPDARTELDYVEFALLVEQMSAALWDAGVRPWDRVAVAKSSNFDIVAIACAAARIGAIPALLSPGLDGEIMGVLLERLESPFLYTDQATVERAKLPAELLERLPSRVIGPVEGGTPIEDLWGGSVPPPAPRTGDEPMLITHTSSTTGISKLVENSVAGVCYSTRVEATVPFGHSPRELAAHCISFVHVRAAITAMASWARGTALLEVGVPDAENVLRLFPKYRPTAVEAHPNAYVAWEQLRDHPDEPFANIRVYFSTFDAAHPRTISRLLAASKRTLPLWFQAYGQTEVQIVSVRFYTRGSAERLLRRGTRSRSLGWPPPGVRVRVADPVTQKKLQRGKAGMIQVCTPARSLSFVGTPGKYWERRHGEWFDTGDWGRRTRLGDIEIFDRVADRIEGVESCLWLEDILLDRIQDAEEIVIVPDKEGRPVPVVCMCDGRPLDRAEWRRATAGIPNLGEPFEVSQEDLKRTATAKARRYLLTELIAARTAAPENGDSHAVPPELLLREGA
jgi:acyl-coenzyme A synthetase/AMP-(fatty) acid ligase